MRRQVVEQLVTELTADGAKMRQEFTRSVSDAKSWGRSVGAIIAGVGAAFSIKSLIDDIKETAQYSKEVENLSRVANISSSEMQRLSFATSKYGIEQDKAADILKDVNDKVGDFLTTGAGPMADFFETIAPRVGVTAEEFRNLSGKDALQLYVSSLEKANLSQAEMTFFMEAIASDATALLPLFSNNGKELKRLSDRAEELGTVLSNVEIDSYREVDQLFSELGVTIDVTGRKITSGALPAMRELVEVLSDENTVKAAQAIAGGIVTAFSEATKAITGTVNVVQFLGDELAAALNGPALDDIVRIEDQIEEVETLLNGNLFEKANRLRFFGKDGLVEYYDREELQTSLSELKKARDDFYKNQSSAPLLGQGPQAQASNDPTAPSSNVVDIPLPTSAKQEAQSKSLIKSNQKLLQQINNDRLRADGNLIKLEEARFEREQTKLQESLALLSEKGLLTEEIEAQNRQAQLDAEIIHQDKLMELKERAQAENDSLVGDARGLYKGLHEERLQAEGNVVDLENMRFQRQREQLEKELNLLRKKGVLTAEIEAEHRQAQLDAEVIHSENLAAIKEENDTKQREMQMLGYTSLLDATASFYSGMEGKEAAYARTAISIGQSLLDEKKRNSLQSIIASTQAAAMGAYESLSSIPYVGPVLGAVAAGGVVVAGGIAASKVLGIAHDGMDSIPQTGTWVLEKGERVTTEKTSARLDRTLDDVQRSLGGNQSSSGQRVT